MSDGSKKYSADMTSSLGIMTLTRTPCELDKMSLFQDLKLKRRKVDSRCSSDGESVADTSTSSPDLLCPASPKISADLTMASQSPQSPDSLTGATNIMNNNNNNTSNNNNNGGRGVGLDEGNPEEPSDSSVFDGGGSDKGRVTPPNSMEPPLQQQQQQHHEPPQTASPQSVIRPPQHCPSPRIQNSVSINRGTKRSFSPNSSIIRSNSSPIRTPSPPSNAVNVINSPQKSQSPHQIRQSPVHFIQNNQMENMRERMSSPSPVYLQRQSSSSIHNVHHSAGSSLSNHAIKSESPIHIRQSPCSPAMLSPSPVYMRQNSQSQPSNIYSIGKNENSNYSVRMSPIKIESPVHMQKDNRAQSPIGTIRHTPQSPIHTIRNSPIHISPGSIDMKQSPPGLVLLPQSPRRSPVHQTIHPPPAASPHLSLPYSQRNTPSVITSQHAAVIQSQFWVQSSRINGVKPELIGGNFGPGVISSDMKPPALLMSQRNATTTQNSTQIRQTPTVIMGEVGGVRTMIWSQPSVNLNVGQTSPLESPQIHASTSNLSSSSSSNSAISSNPEENAAQMLLNLGQDRARQAAAAARTQLGRAQTATTPSSNALQSQQQQPPQSQHTNVPLNMERLWAGDLSQLPANQQIQALNLSSQHHNISSGVNTSQHAPLMYLNRANSSNDIKPPVSTTLLNESGGLSGQDIDNPDEEDQPMICMICEDKATGLHYGIITCEGCKGFFKRTVQNRRVYTCVADGNCEITKAQRNRCQYCRFKKCIEQGMVLQAVREDRMPGGRNSGAVYNLYKVKYKKHKKTTNKQIQQQQQKQQNEKVMHQVKTEMNATIPPHLVNGTILKTALTNPSEVVHLRQRLDNAVSSSRDSRNFSIENILSMVQTLIDCDEFQDIATLQNIDELLDNKSDLSEKLCQIGDSIVYKLVQWTKRLPFYLELPVEVHTRLLTHKWHELLVLTTSAYQAIHGAQKIGFSCSEGSDADFSQECARKVSANLSILQTCLTSMMGRPITMDQLRQDVGLMVEKITHVTLMFRRIRLTMQEYVCLKVITMLSQGRSGNGNGSGATNVGAGNPGNTELEAIQERYTSCLRALTQHMHPQQPQRFHELLIRLPEIQSAAALLLESKMFYVPFLLNSAIQR